LKEASAYTPGHLTGFFQICDEPEDPLLKGSRGSGISITQGVHTKVKVCPADQSRYYLFFDNEPTDDAFVSENVLVKMLGKADQPYEVEVRHVIETTLGAGFGSSGGGAMSLALALNKALDLGLTYLEAAQVAHVAEIECKTGLGTVFAATVGGFGALVKPGGPGVGEFIKYPRSSELSVIYLPLGPMATKDALSDPDMRRRINEVGGRYVDRISEDIRPDLFMELSQKFTKYLDISTPRLKAVLERAWEQKVPCTMAMFGEVAFSLVSKEEAGGVASFLREVSPGRSVEVVGIDDRGARLT
jgi:pantoate kinase